MIEEEDARERVLGAVPETAGEKVALENCAGRFSCERVVARVALPGFDNSGMDGYAVRAEDAVVGARLRIAGVQPAGVDLGLVVEPGHAIRIYTGAPLPTGADAVVMQEDTELDGEWVRILDAAVLGEFIRRKGADVCPGEVLVGSGDRLTAAIAGVLASQGIAEISCGVPPRVTILATGDELVKPGDALRAGQLYNSNLPMLAALFRRAGAREVRMVSCEDSLAATTEVLREASRAGGMVVVSGGVSVGDRDFVKPAMVAAGYSAGFWRVRVKPGKPFVFGKHEASGALLFGLPGNPVSAYVTAMLFALPALRRWCGAGETFSTVSVMLEAALTNGGDRPHYLRGTVRDGKFSQSGLQQSHALAGLAGSEVLVRVEAETRLSAGSWVRALVVM